MNSIKLNSNGLTARQRAIDKIISSVSRYTFWALMLMACLLLLSCDKKNKEQHIAEKKDSSIKQDSIKPKVSIKVNRHYDDKGNMIGFDSTYSSYYSNAQGDTAKMDSLFHNFDQYFNNNNSSFLNKEFNALFFNDSLRYPDFFHNDFFLKRYELNDAYMRNMMHRMDSIKNNFYNEQSKRKKHSS